MRDERQLMERAAELFDLALRESPPRRERFVIDQAGADPALCEEVFSLLGHHTDSSRFLDERCVAPLRDSSLGSEPPVRLGSYRCLARIGAGGMGVVYLAEQESPRRQVALKVLRHAVANDEVRRRFRYEGEILARLQHPGIAQIHEAVTLAGVHDDEAQAFLVMEYVVGEPLVAYAEGHGLNVRERIALLLRVCDAVQHAHQRGVIHRDLKPANILVTEAGQPKVLDFGVARVCAEDFESTQETAAGQIVGTLAYMSPEQASGCPERVDTRTDVHALGVLAYELLAGERPFDLDGLAFHTALERVITTEAPRLGARRPEYRGDLETIVAKALEKDPARRYGSVAQLSGDLRAFLGDEPISVHSPSTLYAWKKLVRKHRTVVCGVAAGLVLLVGAVVVTTTLAWQLREQRDLARAAENVANDRADEAAAIALFLEDVFVGGEAYVGRHDLTVAEALAAASEEIDGRFAERPALAAKLHWRISSVYYSRGQLDEALGEGRAALAARREIGARSDEDTDPKLVAMSLADLGGMLDLKGATEEAGALLEESVGLFEQHGLVDDPYYLTALINWGVHLLRVGEYARAEPPLRQALAQRRRVHGDEHPYTLTALNNLATLLRRMGRLEEAVPMIEENLALSRRVLGERHPNAITAIYNTADLFREMGRHGESEELFLEALELGEAHLPEGHWLLGLYLSRYGELLVELERVEEARDCLAEGLAILAAGLGDEHERTQRAQSALAAL